MESDVVPLGHVVKFAEVMLLEGILRNLVHNAVRYTRAAGRVLVGCRRRAHNVRIDVYDNGIGMTQECLSRIFDAFQRIHPCTTDGLGLVSF